ncbi:L-aspartate transporter [Piscirickettsia salmonis]|uniref:APC family permease n=1 Tax=Piscirickettsia salmonis TaxID=1238 RepID=UPI0012BA61B8|nr:APC family permease [Piscirickettsia salmonis]QGP62450.1 L-aspartate transporter [Piscirickettsia salmonis]
MKFKRNISTLGMLFTALSGIIGSGWLFGPYFASQIAGPAAIFGWALAGILMIIIALNFTELATMYPEAGGLARFAHKSHGPIVGFTMAWVVWISSVIVAPIETLAALQYLATYVPSLMKQTGNSHELSAMGIVFAAIVMFALCLINALGVKSAAKTNTVIVFFKFAIPLLTAIILLSHSFHTTNFTSHQFLPTGVHGVLAALPAAGIAFSFMGWSAAIQMAGEAKNPQRSIPIALIGAICIGIIIYSIIQVSFIGALPADALSHGWANLSFKGDMGPFAGLLTAIGLGAFVIMIYADAVYSPLGTVLVYTTATARVTHALASHRYVPTVLTKLSSRGVPVYALAINFIVGMCFFLPFPGWQAMAEFIVSAFIISYAIGPTALIVLRDIQPEQPRPFKLPAYKAFSMLTFYVCNMLLFWTGWHTVSKLIIIIIIGYGVYFSYFKFSKQRLDTGALFKAIWLIPYLMGVTVISYLGSYGGGHDFIHFGADFFIIALFSFIIFTLAYWCGIHGVKRSQPGTTPCQLQQV